MRKFTAAFGAAIAIVVVMAVSAAPASAVAYYDGEAHRSVTAILAEVGGVGSASDPDSDSWMDDGTGSVSL